MAAPAKDTDAGIDAKAELASNNTPGNGSSSVKTTKAETPVGDEAPHEIGAFEAALLPNHEYRADLLAANIPSELKGAAIMARNI
jgi:hypothetical protein